MGSILSPGVECRMNDGASLLACLVGDENANTGAFAFNASQKKKVPSKGGPYSPNFLWFESVLTGNTGASSLFYVLGGCFRGHWRLGEA